MPKELGKSRQGQRMEFLMKVGLALVQFLVLVQELMLEQE